jgi:hypothetical protein
LGNGFTIDLMSRFEAKKIDTRDLFKYGSHVIWPEDDDPGCLSYKNTPNLWSLGVRPGISSDQSKDILEDIITCNNVYSILTEKPKDSKSINSLYRNAYKELSVYLHFLFSFYNNQISDKELLEKVTDWHYFKFIKRICSDESNKICIVTYNYDVWLERIFKLTGIKFYISGIEENGEGIKIVKPHGSISFLKEYIEPSQFQSINLDTEPQDCQARDFKILYEELNRPRLFYPLIPPAGESGRMKSSWAKTIRTEASQFAVSMKEDDNLIIIGISYWNVDREEIDELITSVNSSVKTKYVNPFPNRTLMAVMTSIFSKFVFYDSPEAIEGVRI